MDEIDWKKRVRKALLIFTIVPFVLCVFFDAIMLIGNSNYSSENMGFLLFPTLLISISIPAVVLIGFLILSLVLKILNTGSTEISFDKEYIRELPKHCSPAIASLIYDLKIDVYKDYTATILYLYSKKFIDLVKNGDGFEIKVLEHPDYYMLGRCEKYVVDVLENDLKFDENKFKNEIIIEAQEKGLITDEKHIKIEKIVLVLVLMLLSLIIFFNINKIVFLILISVFGGIFYAIYVILGLKYENRNNLYFFDTEYVRTRYGKKTALRLKGLKRFIKEYTLINEREIGYIQLLEDYIPYALALDEADTIDNFIKYDEAYRNLIYNRKNIYNNIY